MRRNLLLLVALLPAGTWLGMHLLPIVWSPSAVVGAVLCTVSMVLLFVARWQLGASFAVRAKARTLVTTGLYARVLNPIYVCGLGFQLRLAMILHRWEMLALTLVMTPVQIFRARNEARVLEAAFGGEYHAYRARTWF